VDHQVKKLRGFSLKLKRLTSRHGRHHRSPEEFKKAGGRCLKEARPQSEPSILTESMGGVVALAGVALPVMEFLGAGRVSVQSQPCGFIKPADRERVWRYPA
jgi:hypothetical protein